MTEDSELASLFCDTDEPVKSQTSISKPARRVRCSEASQRRMRQCASVGSIQSLWQWSKLPVSRDDAASNIYLPPEVEEGNIEYKRKLVNLSKDRFEHLVTQLNWRLAEGEGEAIYELGVEDDGRIEGLESAELKESLDTLRRMADRLGAQVTVLRERHVSAGEELFSQCHHSSSRLFSDVSQLHLKRSLEVLVKRQPLENMATEIRLVLLGNMDAGKSTLVGVLSQGELDNGRGRARLNLFRHPHEMLSGRTSCISSEQLLFNGQGESINPRGVSQQRHSLSVPSKLCSNWTMINTEPSSSNSPANSEQDWWTKTKKVVTLIDLAGHKKYQRTTLYGLTSRVPHFAMLVVSAASGFVRCSQDHCLHALALQLPLIVVINKCDLASPDAAFHQLQTWLRDMYSENENAAHRSCFPLPALAFPVHSKEEAKKTAIEMNDNRFQASIVPVFCVSCVNGTGLHLLNHFLGQITLHTSADSNVSDSVNKVLFLITQTHNLSSVPGVVLQGLLERGKIENGQTLYIGPGQNGSFMKIVVNSVYKNRLAQRYVAAGESASLAVQQFNNVQLNAASIRKGMVLLSQPPSVHDLSSGSTWEFEAEIFSFFTGNEEKGLTSSQPHTFLVKQKQCTIYCGGICQAAVVKSKEEQSNSHHPSILFRFVKQPEFVQVNKSFIFRNGLSQGHGTVLRIFPHF